MSQQKIAFVGAGHMARSIISGLITAGYNPDAIWASNPHVDKLDALQQEFQIHTTESNINAVEHADIVIFAVKPQNMLVVIEESKAIMQKRHPLLISIAAGIKTATFTASLGDEIKLILAMPNTPAVLQLGMTSLYANDRCDAATKQRAADIFQSVGKVIWLDSESQMDVATAIAGGGPAYFFLLMETFIQAAVTHGMDPQDAQTMVCQTVCGAAAMANESTLDLTALREQVMSKGGTTAQAIDSMQQHGLADIIDQAMQAAIKRAQELSS